MNASSLLQRLRSHLLELGFVLVTGLFAAVLIRWPDNFFADDSYFYFQVAWNIAHGHGSTFNQVMPTNGYHPLWMLLCVLNYKIIASKALAVHGIAVMISLLDAGALLLMVGTLRRVAPHAWWCAVTLYVPFAFLTQLGTEGALSGFFLAAYVASACLLATRPGHRHAFLFAFTGALAILSRLDNVFIVGLMYLAVLVLAPPPGARQIRRLALLWSPLAILLCAAYLAGNKLWFGILQPISGMLKQHAHGESGHVQHLPHLALLALAIILPSLLFLALTRRDAFFRVVEAPFALGVLLHATYIVFFMSSETRWTWYYTSWILLSGILLSRVVSSLFPSRQRSLQAGLATALVLLAALWFFVDYRSFAHPQADVRGEGFQQNLADRLHAHEVLAFDKPGRMAYYSTVPVVALDGLMGDLRFQEELASQGIAEFDARTGADLFIGPPVPFDPGGKAIYCDRIFLSSVQFHCVPDGPGQWMPDRVEVFARLTGQSAGTLALPPSALVWNQKNLVAAWKLPAPRRNP
jgi:hypothetical protein